MAASYPEALAIAPDGAVWYGTNGLVPYLVRFDPETEARNQLELTGGTVVRGIATTPRGEVVLACAKRDRIVIATLTEPNPLP